MDVEVLVRGLWLKVFFRNQIIGRNGVVSLGMAKPSV
jgi:hypothetical protein